MSLTKTRSRILVLDPLCAVGPRLMRILWSEKCSFGGNRIAHGMPGVAQVILPVGLLFEGE